MPTVKIRITFNSAHPHFGGHTIKTRDYSMAEGARAEADYQRFSKQAAESRGYETVEIAIVHVETP